MNQLVDLPVIADSSPKPEQSNGPFSRVFDELKDFCRSRSLFMLHYCTGCGAIELPPAMTSRFDMERLGIQPMVTPRQADILLITGYVSIKTMKRIILTYEQMGSPKYVIGICSCTVNGGMYWQSYATAKKLNDYLPVDVYIAGCMPRPEAVIAGMRHLITTIRNGQAQHWKEYYRHYDYYLGNQQKLFGERWQTPTDIVGEARHYNLFGAETQGEHTELLEKHRVPLPPFEMRLGLSQGLNHGSNHSSNWE
jgi:NADH:ubiquinone oxidoreductase subunit B-like Fe-S oxidoreductase